MRWFWIDRYTEFVSGQQATAVKNVSLAEDHLHDHFPGSPIMPASLIVEGIAQAGGIMLGQATGFERQVVLAKVAKARFYFEARAGDTLVYHVEAQDIRDDGAIISGTSRVGERLQAEVELVFAQLGSKGEQTGMFERETLLNWLRMIRMYEVGVNPDGSRIEEPVA